MFRVYGQGDAFGEKVRWEDGGVFIERIHPPVKVWTVGEKIGDGVCDTGNVVKSEVIVSQHFHPAGLATGDAVGFTKVSEVVMVSEDAKGVSCAEEVMAPVSDGFYNGKQFLVVNIVIQFSRL